MFKFAVHIKYYDNDSNFKGKHFFRTTEADNETEAKHNIASELSEEYKKLKYNIKSIKLTLIK